MPCFSGKYPNQNYVQMTCARGRLFHRAFNLERHLVDFLAPPARTALISFHDRISDLLARHREHQVAIGVNGDSVLCRFAQDAAEKLPLCAVMIKQDPSRQERRRLREGPSTWPISLVMAPGSHRTPGPCVAHVCPPGFETDPLVARLAQSSRIDCRPAMLERPQSLLGKFFLCLDCGNKGTN